MPLYNVHSELGAAGRLSRVYSFTALNDAAAERFVAGRLTNRPVELWCYERRVFRFDPNQAG
jgi:hypothetical protein